MTSKRSVAVALLVLLAALSLSASIAAAGTTVTTQERATFERAMARFARVLAATTPTQVDGQMRAEEARLAPCAGSLKTMFATGNPNIASIGSLLGIGVHASGEQWFPNAAIPLDRAVPPLNSNWFAGSRAITHIDVCSVAAQWATQSRAEVVRSKAYGLVLLEYSPSPLAFIAPPVTRTFARWGFSPSAVTQLAGELNRGLARYKALNQLAGEQFIAWLHQQGMYQVLPTWEQQSLAHVF